MIKNCYLSPWIFFFIFILRFFPKESVNLRFMIVIVKRILKRNFPFFYFIKIAPLFSLYKIPKPKYIKLHLQDKNYFFLSVISPKKPQNPNPFPQNPFSCLLPSSVPLVKKTLHLTLLKNSLTFVGFCIAMLRLRDKRGIHIFCVYCEQFTFCKIGKVQYTVSLKE